ncbi:MAG: hypothetical protein H0T79_16250 [Deltaproteobacteria bacterium]|nr:hypothetical protein [Deltaproteobacteria bacterium]
MRRIAGVLVVVGVFGCGDNPASVPDAPVGAADAPEIAVTAECHELEAPSATPFATGADFSPATPGSLAGWSPDGRWFLTGVRVGPSSFHFAQSGSAIVIDRDAENPGTIDDTEIFQRTAFEREGSSYVVARRVSNRLSDGSLRAERAVCDGSSCRVCTARLIRAERNAGEGESSGISLLSEFAPATWDDGITFNVRVLGTLAYVIRGDGLHIVETADPANPVEVGHYQRTGDGYSNDVKLVETATKRYALIADFPVDVVDVTDPTAPVLALQIPQDAHTLAVEQRDNKVYAYFGNYDGTCPIYDVTNPAAPQKLGSYTSPGSIVHDLSVENGVAYLNAWEGGFVAVDYANPAQPQLVGRWADTPTATSHSNWTTTVGGRHIAIHGEETFGAHLNVVDIDPASPTFMQPIGEWKTRDWVSIHNLMAFGSKAYFTHYQDGIRVLDLSDPTAPTQLGYFNTWDPQADYATSAFFEGAVGLDVDLTRKLIFVADTPRGLLILRDATP